MDAQACLERGWASGQKAPVFGTVANSRIMTSPETSRSKSVNSRRTVYGECTCSSFMQEANCSGPSLPYVEYDMKIFRTW